MVTILIVYRVYQPCRHTEAIHQQPNQLPVMGYHASDSINISVLFSRDDAEKVTGEPMYPTGGSTQLEGGALNYRYAYTAHSKINETERRSALYFLLRHYGHPGSAEVKYHATKSANEGLGIETLDGLGDEAYFHTDSENFYFIMVRKGNKLFNLKVNKITASTSLEEFHALAKKIASGI
jgi:hypothetical protein